MPLVLRSVKGSVLTKDEVDGNFIFLRDTKQPISNTLTSLAAIIGAANQVPVFTGAGAMSTLGINIANGLAQLDASGKISTSQLPPLAVNEVFTVASQAAMLALVAERGDVAIRTDQAGKAYILAADAPSVLSNWIGLDQALSAALGALNVLTPAADKVPYFTGAATAGLLDASTLGKTILAIADAAAARTAITAAKSGANSDVTSLSGLTTALSVLQGGTGVTTIGALLTALITTGAYAKSNTIGTVSQSGGVPTGALFETVNNANGTAIKFADGTMICRQTLDLGSVNVSTVNGSSFSSPIQTAKSFAVSFSVFPTCHINVISGTASAYIGSFSLPTGSATQPFYVICPTSGAQQIAVVITAIGRWF